ncbi:unnamed protein product [Ectocarpus sp. 12 AP-2014]
MPAKLSCLQQVAYGVRHMHKADIGQGDLKPANILLFDGGGGRFCPRSPTSVLPERWERCVPR